MQKVTVVDDHHVNTEEQKDGKQISTGKWSVSEDGKKLSIEWTYSGNPTGGTVSGVATSDQMAAGPAGSNAISGSWRDEKSDIATTDALLTTFKTSSGDTLSMTSPTGQSYTAKLDGKQVPFVGDPGIGTVSVKRVGDAIEGTDYRDGKAIYFRR